MPLIMAVVDWLSEKLEEYMIVESIKSPSVETADGLVRYWIFLHHLYSKVGLLSNLCLMCFSDKA